MRTRSDVYQSITNQIIEAIEAGAGHWQMPWHRSAARPTNARTGRAYRGVNVVALWAAAGRHGYQSGFWATYKQWRDLGAQVRRGEQATLVVLWKEIERKTQSEDTGEAETKTVLLARASWAFNAAQVDGWSEPTPEVKQQAQALSEADAFIAGTKAVLRHEGDTACYRPGPDEILMPPADRFTGSATSTATEAYYATLLHELIHWTGHTTRLNRDLLSRFGDEAYAVEELIAELGAAFLCADLSIANSPRADHAAYVANWLRVLRNDKRAIFTAASQATRAVGFLAARQEGAGS